MDAANPLTEEDNGQQKRGQRLKGRRLAPCTAQLSARGEAGVEVDLELSLRGRGRLKEGALRQGREGGRSGQPAAVYATVEGNRDEQGSSPQQQLAMPVFQHSKDFPAGKGSREPETLFRIPQLVSMLELRFPPPFITWTLGTHSRVTRKYTRNSLVDVVRHIESKVGGKAPC